MVRAFLVILLSLATLPAHAADFPARVVGVSDGDTLTVLKADKTQVRVRLHGIDAPETGQDYGSRAKQAASELVFGKSVTILPRDTDRYGRTVAEVILPDGRSLGQVLVGQGAAWRYTQYAPNDHELARLEAEARAAKRGLWSMPGAVPPWEWRRGTGVEAGFVGNRRSMLYHRLNCRGVAKMNEANKVQFRSIEDAEKAGYRRAGDCR